MIGKAHRLAASQNLLNRVCHRLPALFVDQPEDRGHRQPHGLAARPAGQPLRRGVEEGDPPPGVGGDHSVAYAGQGHPLELEARFAMPPQPMQHLGKDADQHAAGDKKTPLEKVVGLADQKTAGRRDAAGRAQGGEHGGDQTGSKTARHGRKDDGKH